jgi:hypothetical protein
MAEAEVNRTFEEVRLLNITDLVSILGQINSSNHQEDSNIASQYFKLRKNLKHQNKFQQKSIVFDFGNIIDMA